MSSYPRQCVLIVLDGWGYSRADTHNALARAEIPFFRSLLTRYPWALLDASGPAVGLPRGQAGTSEIGHLTIGSGMTIDTDLVRITKAMQDGTFQENHAVCKLFEHVLHFSSTLHLIGLVSDGGIHSHSDHIHGIVKAAHTAGITRIALHAFTDGRDTLPHTSHKHLLEFEKIFERTKGGRIASVVGRYYAMDRDNNIQRTERASRMLFEGIGTHIRGMRPSEYSVSLHHQGVSDEHFEPLIFDKETQETSALINPNDGVFFFNFRPDRARQLARVIAEHATQKNLAFVTMTSYDPHIPCAAAFPKINIDMPLARILSDAGFSHVHIAETEKYAHVTYFLNGGREEQHRHGDHILIESRRDIPTHDHAPEMRARAITDAAIHALEKKVPFIFINYANADMVGHTGNISAIHEALVCLDQELQRLMNALTRKNACAFITSDHGNVERNYDEESGQPHTAHTTNPVPAILTIPSMRLRAGTLADVAPTILEILNLPPLPTMTGCSLLFH